MIISRTNAHALLSGLFNKRLAGMRISVAFLGGHDTIYFLP